MKLTYYSLSLLLVILIPVSGILAQENVDPLLTKKTFGLSSAELVGFVKYDPEEALDKMKFRRKEELDAVNYLFHNYNAQMDSLAYLYQVPLKNISSEFAQTSLTSQSTGDFRALKEFYEFVEVSTFQLKAEAEKIEEKLNASLSLFLTESQLRHWKHYQKRQKKKAKPRLPMPMSGPIA